VLVGTDGAVLTTGGEIGLTGGAEVVRIWAYVRVNDAKPMATIVAIDVNLLLIELLLESSDRTESSASGMMLRMGATHPGC
jgi:hypothetical protein